LKIAPAAAFVDEVLSADRKAPRKQHHTAKRIWERIRLEVPGCTPAERTVRQYVELRKLWMAEFDVFSNDVLIEKQKELVVSLLRSKLRIGCFWAVPFSFP